MVLRSFVKINLLFRIMDPLKRKSPSFKQDFEDYKTILGKLIEPCNIGHKDFFFYFEV